jgi:ribonuclease HII
MAQQRPLFTAATLDLCAFEKRAQRRGFYCVAGLDEVGRGPLAGPVTAAAVILPSDASLPRVRDSKQLTAPLREILCQEITRRARDFSIASVDAAEIDVLNILQATFEAMLRALQGLRSTPDFLLIDGPYRLPIDIPQQGITRGDQRSLSIAAASILAKVHRDHFMCDQHRLYPAYGFHHNKGYGTREHLEALRRHGPCPIHRRTFRGVCQPES